MKIPKTLNSRIQRPEAIKDADWKKASYKGLEIGDKLTSDTSRWSIMESRMEM